MSCPFAGLATRYTVNDERVSVRICGALPYERDSDPDDLPLPSVCFSNAAWQTCPHYLRLTQRKEIARQLGLVPAGTQELLDADAAGEAALPAEFTYTDPDEPEPQDRRTSDAKGVE
ncbi:MAG TPA: hypothetical protein VKY74_00150 [Chloroflexia bacterium]|nr:hypothetical protein [Chloroflexia bacterium]